MTPERLAMAAVLALGIVLLARHRPGSPGIWLLPLLPVAAVYALGSENRVASFHGFLHLSIVYQLLEGAWPPGNPILAGEPLRYGWLHHALVAGLSRAFAIPPPWAFAGLNLGALVATAWLLERSARRLCGSRAAAVLGVVVALCAMGFVKFVVPAAWISDVPGIPPVMKFTNTTAMALGILCVALFLDATSEIASRPAAGWRTDLRMWLSVAGAGLLYPLLWLGIVVGGAAALATLLLRSEAEARPRLWRAGVVAGVGVLCALPYLLFVGQPEQSEPVIGLAGFRHVLRFAPTYVLLLLPVAGLLAYARREVLTALRAAPAVAWALGAVVVANALLYVAVTGPVSPGIEYKFRTVSYLPLGLLAGLGLERLVRLRAWLAVPVLAAMLVPLVLDLERKLLKEPIAYPFVERGLELHHADPAEDAVYTWIAAHTARDAAFVDGQLGVPVFARRALFVGLDDERRRFGRRHPGARYHDGWGMLAERTLATVVGSPPAELRSRLQIARSLLLGRELDAASAALADALARARLRELYVLARRLTSVRALEAHASFEVVFANPAATLFRFTGRGA